MGTRSLVLIGTILLLVASARGELQLTPKLSEYELDGIKCKQLVFSDGNGKDITYAPPTGWEYSGSAAKFTLHPPNKRQAEGTISKVSLSQPTTFDEETMKKLTEEALAAVPKGSTNVTILSREKNPLLIERKETFLVTISYTFYGENYQRSIMFLNRGNEQVRFQFVSRAGDFKDLQRAFLGSQFSWQNL
jgi:hypothetical protein